MAIHGKPDQRMSMSQVMKEDHFEEPKEDYAYYGDPEIEKHLKDKFTSNVPVTDIASTKAMMNPFDDAPPEESKEDAKKEKMKKIQEALDLQFKNR